MLKVKPVARETIDGWPIADSGLPVRVVNSVATANVLRIGELRTWTDQQLLALRSLGRISLGHVRGFFKLCNQIEQGKQSFQTIREVFTIFLDEAEMKVISARYGFEQRELTASRNWATLQQIGNADGKTRERVRQIQETAFARLKSRLATVCLQPFLDYFTSYIENLGRAASCADLAPLQNDPVLASYNICSILLLLSDLHPDRITFYHRFFSTLPLPDLQGIEAKSLETLTAANQAVTLDSILKTLAEAAEPDSADHQRRVVTHVLDHCPSVAATLDGRYFLFNTGTRAFLAELLRDMERPAHYRTVTNVFNERLKPLSRKGAGFVLEMLNSSPQCTRVDRGIYDLKAV